MGVKLHTPVLIKAGNFRIGDGIEINQTTGSISGNIYIRSLFTQVTPFILALEETKKWQ